MKVERYQHFLISVLMNLIHYLWLIMKFFGTANLIFINIAYFFIILNIVKLVTCAFYCKQNTLLGLFLLWRELDFWNCLFLKEKVCIDIPICQYNEEWFFSNGEKWYTTRYLKINAVSSCKLMNVYSLILVLCLKKKKIIN